MRRGRRRRLFCPVGHMLPKGRPGRRGVHPAATSMDSGMERHSGLSPGPSAVSWGQPGGRLSPSPPLMNTPAFCRTPSPRWARISRHHALPGWERNVRWCAQAPGSQRRWGRGSGRPQARVLPTALRAHAVCLAATGPAEPVPTVSSQTKLEKPTGNTGALCTLLDLHPLFLTRKLGWWQQQWKQAKAEDSDQCSKAGCSLCHVVNSNVFLLRWP